MGCGESKNVEAMPAQKANPQPAAGGPPQFKKDLVVDMNFDVVTDLETTYKYNINRTQML